MATYGNGNIALINDTAIVEINCNDLLAKKQKKKRNCISLIDMSSVIIN